MKTIISIHGVVKCVVVTKDGEAAYPPEVIKSMKAAGYTIKVLEDDNEK